MSWNTTTSHAVLLCTVPNADVAQLLSRQLVERSLAACVSTVGPIRSVYHWQGEVCDEAEYLLLIKTTRDRCAELADVLVTLHPYDTPELVEVPLEGGLSKYLDWISACTGQGPSA